nr:photosystem I assembly protein Ycf4, chloroplast [Tanacetum cinerariifolium]
MAWTFENARRRFKGCPIREKDKKCGVYRFLDLKLPSDYYKRLLYDLQEENKALKRMNKMSGVIKDSSKRLPNYSNNQMFTFLIFYIFGTLSHKKQQLIIKIDKGKDLIVLSSDTGEDMNEASSVASVPKKGPSVASVAKEGPSIRKRNYFEPELAKVFKAGPPLELLQWYGYFTVDEYRKDTYFDDTDNDTTDNSMMDTFPSSIDKDTTDNETTDKKITVGTTCKNLLFYEATLEKYVPVGKSISDQGCRGMTKEGYRRLWKARSVAMNGEGYWRGFRCQGCLEALVAKRGDGGACKMIRWILGDATEPCWQSQGQSFANHAWRAFNGHDESSYEWMAEIKEVRSV